MTRSFGWLASFTVAMAFAACGGESKSTPANEPDGGEQIPNANQPAPNDAGTSAPNEGEADANVAPPDNGSTVYPALKPPFPMLKNHGGPLLTSAKIVTITFAGDELRERLEAFGDVIATTPWWKSVSAEYCAGSTCIGEGSNGGHVVIPTAPDPSYTDLTDGGGTIEDFIKKNVADGTFPAPTNQTLYMVYLPLRVTVTLDGDRSCRSFGAYHKSVNVTLADGTVVDAAYAIMPRCGDEQMTTVAASHELVEAATDATPTHRNGFVLNDAVWARVRGGGEVADLCVGGNDTILESGFAVQRSWSNKSASEGHDPCVPLLPNDVYFNVAPAKKEVRLAVGESATIELTAYSDAPLDAWAVSVTNLEDDMPELDAQLDKKSVRNGVKLVLTLKLNKALPNGYALLGIISRVSQRKGHLWPIYVEQR